MEAKGETSADSEWEEHRGRYINKLLPLYKASLKGDWEAASKIIVEDRDIVHAIITRGSQTVLHVAAGAGHDHFVEQLVKFYLTGDDLEVPDANGNTAFCFAVAAGNMSMAKLMIDTNGTLPQISGGEGMSPLYMAALFGHEEMAFYLYPQFKEKVTNDIRERDGIFFTCIKNDLYGLALKMLGDYLELAIARDVNGESALHLLARKPSLFAIKRRGIWKQMADCFGDYFAIARDVNGKSALHLLAQTFSKKKTKYFVCPDGVELLKSIWEIVVWQQDSIINNIIRDPPNVLFFAAKIGNFDFVAELLDSYPELIWETDKHNQSLFHIAVLHHDTSFFNLLLKFALFKDLMVSFKDEEGNNILHLAAMLGPPHKLNTVAGPALQMQLELSWFKELKKVTPPFYQEMRNEHHQTPGDIFTEQHRSLLGKGELWMKNVACLGTLVSTFMFASVVSHFLSEGRNTLTGVKQTPLCIFVISDILAMLCSSIAILAFLSTYLSRFREDDFLYALPLKLLIGLISFFVSTAALTVSFGTSLHIAYRDRLKWLPFLYLACAYLLFVGFNYLHSPMVSYVLASTCYSRYLFRPTKRKVLEIVRHSLLLTLLFWFIPYVLLKW